MEKLLWCSLVLISFFNVFGQTDMHKKAFVFPKESDNSYVSLKAPLKKPLKAFNVCLHIYSELALTRSYSIFSYATKKQANEILIYWSKGRGYLLTVHGTEVVFRSPENPLAPTHICVSWESDSGIAELWIDGKPMVRKSLEKGTSLGTEASIILGQDQDSFGGGYDKNQSSVGDIGDVNMWDSVLSPDEIRTVHSGGTFSPNVLDWRALKYEAHGEVFVKHQLWS
ncbi:C-reactive protein [Camelus dromedarius]|uniref:Pentraxin family member n=1 Tax=Camelus dromedarius TaxID=9838 RepID=A0A5N4CP86_CAMDR|nr:C-reactive protein-like [Camelus dromedarius]KAB1260736.1 C-reactive protein [Camelus dromedarius]